MQASGPTQQVATRKRRRSATVEDGDFETPTQRLVRPRRASTGASNGGAFHAKWEQVSNITEEKERQVYGKKAVCARKTQPKRAVSRKAPVTRSISRMAPARSIGATTTKVTTRKTTRKITRKVTTRKTTKANARKRTPVTQARKVSNHQQGLARFCALLDVVEMMSAEIRDEEVIDDAEDILSCLQLLRDAPVGSNIRRKRSARHARK